MVLTSMCYLSVGLYVLFKFSYKFKDDFIRDLTTKFRNILAELAIPNVFIISNQHLGKYWKIKS